MLQFRGGAGSGSPASLTRHPLHKLCSEINTGFQHLPCNQLHAHGSQTLSEPQGRSSLTLASWKDRIHGSHGSFPPPTPSQEAGKKTLPFCIRAKPDAGGTSLVVQWIGLRPPNPGGPGSTLVRELDPTCMLQLRVRMPQLRSPCAATEPTCCNKDLVQPNKYFFKKQMWGVLALQTCWEAHSPQSRRC